MAIDNKKENETVSLHTYARDPFWDHDEDNIVAVAELDYDAVARYCFRASILWACWTVRVVGGLYWMIPITGENENDSAWRDLLFLFVWNLAVGVGFFGWLACHLTQQSIRGMHAAVTRQGLVYRHVGPQPMLQRNLQISWDVIDEIHVQPMWWCSWLAPHPLYLLCIVMVARTKQNNVTLFGIVNHEEIYQHIFRAKKRISESNHNHEENDDDSTVNTMVSMLESTGLSDYP